MNLTTYFFLAPSRPDAEPYMFSDPTNDFADVTEARAWAKVAADQPGNGAHAFIIEDKETGDQLEEWVRDVRGADGWRALSMILTELQAELISLVGHGEADCAGVDLGPAFGDLAAAVMIEFNERAGWTLTPAGAKAFDRLHLG